VDCADFEIKKDFGKVVQNILDAIPNIRTRNCMTAEPGSGIKMTTCPANPSDSDKVYRCGSYSGAIIVKRKIIKTFSKICLQISLKSIEHLVLIKDIYILLIFSYFSPVLR